MNQYWINKKDNPTCILFFNGWGMDQNAVAHLDFGSTDVCMFYNYRSFAPITNDFAAYQTVVLVAWSLGVWAAAHVISQSDIKMHKGIAINGTPCPVHDRYGIPESIFSMTLEGWNGINRNKFNRRMMGGEQNLTNYGHFLSNRSVNGQQEELSCIYNTVKTSQQPSLPWDVALTGKNDQVFPTINQLNWWKNRTKVTETLQPHFPFIGLERWEQLLTL